MKHWVCGQAGTARWLRQRVRPRPPREIGSSRLRSRALRHAWAEGACAAGAAASESYFSALALHLQASVTQLALLTGLPQWLGSLAQGFSVWAWGRGWSRRGLLLAGVWAQAASLAWMALLPWQFASPAVAWLIVAVVLYFFGHHLAVPQGQSLLVDWVPAQWRGRYFAWRTRGSQLASFLALLSFGLLLQGFQTLGWARAGFTGLFLAACGLRLASGWHWSRIHDPRPAPPPSALGIGVVLRSVLAVPGYLHVVAFASLMAGSVAVASPFFAYLMLERLQFSYAEFMLNSFGFLAASWLVLPGWGRYSDRHGHARLLKLTALGIPWLPLLWTCTTQAGLLFLLQALGGLLWSGFNLASSNLLYERLQGRPAAPYLAGYHLSVSGAMFVGAQAGGWLVEHAPLVWDFPGLGRWVWGESAYVAFAVSTLLRLGVVAVFWPGLSLSRPSKADAPALATHTAAPPDEIGHDRA